MVPGTVSPANSKGIPAVFIFDTEDGTISAWAGGLTPPTNAVIAVDNSKIPNAANGAVYKGLAFGVNVHGAFLFATNFRAGTIDVFGPPIPPAAYSRPRRRTGASRIRKSRPASRRLASRTSMAISSSPMRSRMRKSMMTWRVAGNGFVDVFDTDGHLLRRFASRGPLNSPWGVARASFAFGRFSGEILIGNFGNGKINVFDSRGRFIDELDGPYGKALVIDGLWTLTLGRRREIEFRHPLFYGRSQWRETTVCSARLLQRQTTKTIRGSELPAATTLRPKRRRGRQHFKVPWRPAEVGQWRSNQAVRSSLPTVIRAGGRRRLDQGGRFALEDYLFPSRLNKSLHLSTRQYAHIVISWVEEIGLDPADYGTHSMRRTKASLIYRRTEIYVQSSSCWVTPSSRAPCGTSALRSMMPWNWQSRPNVARALAITSPHASRQAGHIMAWDPPYAVQQRAEYCNPNHLEECGSPLARTRPSSRDTYLRARLQIRNSTMPEPVHTEVHCAAK